MALCCFDIIVIIASTFGIAARARNKGHTGFLFGIIHAFFAIGSEITGVMAGLLIGLLNDPNLNKETATMPIFTGAATGLTVGILFMFMVVGLLPRLNEMPNERALRRQSRSPRDGFGEINGDYERREI